MNDSSQQNQSVFPFVLLAVLSAVAIFDATTPLDTLRPPQPDRQDKLDEEFKIERAIDSRVWQDPFARGGFIEGDVRDEALPKLSKSDGESVLVLSVFMSGQLRASARENRSRRRYAIHQGMSHAGYRAMHPGTVYAIDLEMNCDESIPVGIEIFETDLLSPRWYTDQVKVKGSDEISVTFGGDSEDRFRGSFHKVVVVYLRSGDMGQDPFGTLQHAHKKLKECEFINDSGLDVTFRAIGPVDSGQVYDFLEKVEKDSEQHLNRNSELDQIPNAFEHLIGESLKDPVLSPVEPEKDGEDVLYVFSPIATADFETLRGQAANPDKSFEGFEPAAAKSLKDRFKQLKVARGWLAHFSNTRYIRTIHNDSSVLGEIVRELQLRQVIADEEDLGKVALIVESDTRYGRAMPVNFLKGARQVLGGENFNESFRTRMNELRVFPYISGLDGNVPELSKPKPEDETGTSMYPGMGNSTMLVPSKVDWQDPLPDGYHQVDYVRRLARKIIEQSRSADRPIRAIGILGTDVYDKLLLMRALKPLLGEVVFFTTDLDARLWYSSELRFTRNLIVGSSHPLGFNSGIQRFVPPFRDSYQASLFVSVLAATNTLVHPYEIERYEPQVFEISNDGPVYLRGGNYRRFDDNDTIPEGIPLFDTSQPNYQNRALVSWTVGFVLMWILIDCFNRTVKRRYCIDLDLDEKRQVKVGPYKYLKYILCTFFVIGTIAFLSIGTKDFEPVYIFRGISAWPSFCLNIFGATLAACYCIFITKTRIEAGNRVLDGVSDVLKLEEHEGKSSIRSRSKLLELMSMQNGYTGFLSFLVAASAYGYTMQWCVQEGMLGDKWGWFLAPIVLLVGWIAFGLYKSIGSFYDFLDIYQKRKDQARERKTKPAVAGDHENEDVIKETKPKQDDLDRSQTTKAFVSLVNDPWKIRVFALPLALLMTLTFAWAVSSGYNYLPLRTFTFKIAFEMSQLLQVGTMLTLLSYVVYEAVWVTAVILNLIRRTKAELLWDDADLLKHQELTKPDEKEGTEDLRKRLEAAKLNRATRCIRFVSELTEVPNRYLTYPFIVLLVYFISQSTDFEGWAWSEFRLVFAASLFGICLVPAALMRMSALYLRRLILQEYTDSKLKDAVGREPPDEMDLVDGLRSIRRGAYAPFVNQPIVYAILTPLGGLGTFALFKLLLESLSV